jgi:tetratricopeptide (TPR) repeat protein
MQRKWPSVERRSTGLAQARRGHHAEAIRAQRRSLDLDRGDGNRYREAITLTDLAAAFLAADQANRAIDPAQAALSLRQEQGDPHGQADALRLLGQALSRLGEHCGAARYRDEAEALSVP